MDENKIKAGDKVEHKTFKSWLLVLEVFDDERFIGRTRDLKEHVLHSWEVRIIK